MLLGLATFGSCLCCLLIRARVWVCGRSLIGCGRLEYGPLPLYIVVVVPGCATVAGFFYLLLPPLLPHPTPYCVRRRRSRFLLSPGAREFAFDPVVSHIYYSARTVYVTSVNLSSLSLFPFPRSVKELENKQSSLSVSEVHLNTKCT